MSHETYARQHSTYRTVDESILLAAKRLIAQQGFRAMNVIDLALEAEVSRATLYNHFRDKEAIGIALAQYEVEGALAFHIPIHLQADLYSFLDDIEDSGEEDDILNS